MDHFIVNVHAQSNGDHEVHNATKNCKYLPLLHNQLDLGLHNGCAGAVKKAKESYPRSNGCYYCANRCHTS